MAKPPKDRDQRQDATDLDAGAWDRFERAVDVVAKSKPRPRPKTVGKPIAKKGKSPTKSARNRSGHRRDGG